LDANTRDLNIYTRPSMFWPNHNRTAIMIPVYTPLHAGRPVANRITNPLGTCRLAKSKHGARRDSQNDDTSHDCSFLQLPMSKIHLLVRFQQMNVQFQRSEGKRRPFRQSACGLYQIAHGHALNGSQKGKLARVTRNRRGDPMW
jgi:hypothetical protein